MTKAELAKYDGRDGRKAYIAVNGKIYDVSESPRWANGLHPPNHQAGKDLTDELAQAPHVRAVVERFPMIGTLEEPQPGTGGNGGKITIAVVVVAIIVALVIFLML